MQPDTILTLGDFQFARHEIPERIPFGGEQMLNVHRLVGGKRVIDAMGRDDAPIEWSGVFLGQNATERARYLDTLRVSGKPLDLSFDLLRYSVVIASFHAEFHRYYQVPYRINLVVVEDLTLPVTTIADAGIDELIGDDMTTAGALGDSIGDSALSTLLGTLDSAISAVSSFATAAQSTIASVLQPIAAVQQRVTTLIGQTGSMISNVTSLGGILPNNPIAQQTAKLSAQVGAMTQLPLLYQLQAVTGRMSANLGTVGGGSRTVTQAGGNLYGMAAQQYGDATAWTTIAKANKLSDPQLTGVNTLVIPATSDNSGGVLDA